MQRLFFLLLFLFASLTLSAATVPYRLFAAPNVKVWTYDTKDYVALARRLYPEVRFRSLVLPDDCLSDAADLIEAADEVDVVSNVVGGFGDPFRLGQGRSAVAVVVANVLAWQLTGRAARFDRIERAFYNALGRAARDTSETERRLAAEVYISVPQLIYGCSPDERDLYVNLYTNATANLTMGGRTFMLDQITSMPEVGSVKFRFSQLADSLPLRLHLRMPDWVVRRHTPGGGFVYADKRPVLPKVYVNGHEQEGLEVDSAGYVVLERTWRSREEVFLDFDLSPVFLRHTLNGKEVRGAVALQRGPLVYQVTDDTRGCYFAVNRPPRVENGLLYGTMYRDEGTPADASAPERPYCAVPYASGAAGTLWQREMR